MLEKIHDCDNVVRWTSAKGLARICSRLPREIGAQVVCAVLDMRLDEEADAGQWHGQCLALAELCRRGCLLPEQLPPVIELISKALLFEKSRANFSISANVRDAACFICWSFARAYDSKLMRELLVDSGLASDLVCLALFDREVNIRRAASAAFQVNFFVCLFEKIL